MAKIKYIKLDASVKNIICHKPKPKRIREYQSKGMPKTVTKEPPLCLKCEYPFISKNGYRICDDCRKVNNSMGDFGCYGFKSASGRVYL